MFDRTMLAPGPAGTSMIGERTIEGAARRGLERQRREREQQQLALENKLSNENQIDRDTRPEKTLTAQKSFTTDSDLHSETRSTTQSSTAKKGSHFREDENQTFQSSIDTTSSRIPKDEGPVKRERTGGIRGRWERIQRKFRGLNSFTEKNIHITDHQYDIGLTVFYLTYICSELPSNLVLKKVSPKIWLPFLTAVWRIITMCLGFVKNYTEFVAVRAILGIAKGGLLPDMVLYLSTFYRRGDLALRIGLFYTAASLSGAFGGLLARGLAEIGPRGDLEGWRWIFIIEGLLTFICGVLSYIVLPNTLESASFLTTEEKEFGRTRLMLDNPRAPDGTPTSEQDSFRWSEVARGALDLQVWLSATAYFAILSGLYSFGLFLPTIIENLGFAKDANEVQLWSVIPYAVAAVITVLVAFVSDRLRLRGIVMLVTLPIAMIGYAVIANIDSPRVQYGMTFLMATGQYAIVPCILVWKSNNSAGHYKRATTSALQLAIANCGGFVATFNYPSRDGPHFHRGHTIILGLLVFAWFMILLKVLYCAKINRDKRNGAYDRFVGYSDDRNPNFKMVL